ncbi:hypothetical protein [Phage ST231]|nr:hypothetical protein [Phage ST231]
MHRGRSGWRVRVKKRPRTRGQAHNTSGANLLQGNVRNHK